MANYLHVLIFSLAGGVFSLIGGILLLSSKRLANKLAIYATPFAAGALLSAVFLDLLPEGMEVAEPRTVMISTLIGILFFFFAERFLRWFHHHHEHKGNKAHDPSVNLVIFGDTLHNALDGVAIGAAFLISIPTGIITTIAVAAHEIPQEIGDFGLLLRKGMRRKSVLLVNLFSALATTVAALVTFAVGGEDNIPLGALLGLISGLLLYVAMSDIIPSIHQSLSKRHKFSWQPLLLLLSVGVVWCAILLAE